MISLAEKTLKQNQSLSKLIITEHPQRFDTPFLDPTSVWVKAPPGVVYNPRGWTLAISYLARGISTLEGGH